MKLSKKINVPGYSLNNNEYNSDYEEDKLIKNYSNLRGFEINSKTNEDVVHKSVEAKDTFESTGDGNLVFKSFEYSDKQLSTLEEHKFTDFVCDFMKSKENAIKLIALYKNRPNLWNTSLPTYLKLKSERVKCLKQTAAQLEDAINVKITHKQLNNIIVDLRRKYRTELEKDQIADGKKENQLESDHQSHWLYEHLSFLKPILEKISIATLDNYPQVLTANQIVQMLDIYKRCPFLWNTSLMENYCYNKRSEGIQQMIRLINLEMDLKVDENTLQRYVHCVNISFAKEKRRYMGIVPSEEGQSEYFEHMMFLYDHVGPFECSECQQKFKNPLYLKVHKSEHGEQITLKCSICKKDFKSAESYIYHVRRHMNDFNNTCTECGKGFLKASVLRYHMRFHTDVRPYCCEFCGASFRTAQVLDNHRMRHEKKFTSFCPTCSKGFYTKCEMEIHNKTHSDERQFICGTCAKAFKTKKNLQQHEHTHEEGQNHICAICAKAFKNKITLMNHFKVHRKKAALDL